jgi:exodeoxyribonuclease-3
MKIATWNVNSLRVRLPHVLRWLAEAQPDILALQETKILDEDFPCDEIKAAGYECIFNGQKTYNGMAVICKADCQDILKSIPTLEDVQRRVLGVTINDMRILNLYVPNGESTTSEKYVYKLHWLEHLTQFLKEELKRYPKLILLGDFNIAPEEVDVHNSARWAGKVLFSDKERAAFKELLGLGFTDCFRLYPQPERSFSWWDYRLNAFPRGWGLRIDHILASPALVSQCQRCYIDIQPRTWERPSDHTPVIAEFG